MIWSTGDSAFADGKGYKPELENLGNVMGQMEFGKYMAGCLLLLSQNLETLVF